MTSYLNWLSTLNICAILVAVFLLLIALFYFLKQRKTWTICSIILAILTITTALIITIKSTPSPPNFAQVTKLSNRLANQMVGSIINFDGVIIHYDGIKIVERYGEKFNKNQFHDINSITKGVGSMAVGFAIQEGLMALDDKVIDYFPKQCPQKIPESLQNLTLRDLLMLRSGYSKEQDKQLLKLTDILASPPDFQSGEEFVYGQISCLLISEMFVQATGRTPDDFIRTRLLIPLGIKHYHWLPSNATIAGGIYFTLEDLAKLGEYYRMNLSTNEWLAQATINQTSETPDMSTNWQSGFGYLFWRNKFGGFRNDGAGGQLLVVLPEQKISIAFFSHSNDFDIPLDLIELFVKSLKQL